MGVHQPPKASQSFALDLSARGHVVLFRPDRKNLCPGCGHSQWYVGRISAECGICGMALPLASENGRHLGGGLTQRAVALHVVAHSGGAEVGEVTDARERRSEERINARGRTLGLHIDGSPHAFRLENISSGGAMGRAIEGMRSARSLSVELDDGRIVPAELRWSDGEFVGLAFLSETKS